MGQFNFILVGPNFKLIHINRVWMSFWIHQLDSGLLIKTKHMHVYMFWSPLLFWIMFGSTELDPKLLRSNPFRLLVSPTYSMIHPNHTSKGTHYIQETIIFHQVLVFKSPSLIYLGYVCIDCMCVPRGLVLSDKYQIP